MFSYSQYFVILGESVPIVSSAFMQILKKNPKLLCKETYRVSFDIILIFKLTEYVEKQDYLSLLFLP